MRAVGSAGRIAGWNDDRSSTFPTEAVAREARAADVVIVGNVKENKDPFCTLDPEVGTGRTNGPGVALAQENCGRMEERNVSMYKSKSHKSSGSWLQYGMYQLPARSPRSANTFWSNWEAKIA